LGRIALIKDGSNPARGGALVSFTTDSGAAKTIKLAQVDEGNQLTVREMSVNPAARPGVLR
jgi:hypothetical protein